MSNRLLDIKEVAERLRIKEGTLYRWRSDGRDMPKATKVGSRVYWQESAVDSWLSAQEAVAA